MSGGFRALGSLHIHVRGDTRRLGRNQQRRFPGRAPGVHVLFSGTWLVSFGDCDGVGWVCVVDDCDGVAVECD